MDKHIFQKAKLALREYILENKEKVVKDLEEMREKSNQNEMKQTAVEWLYDQIENKGKCIYEVINQAKAMEKEQIIEAYDKGYEEGYRDNGKFGFVYYNETFKSK